jgi:hypothetical protein
MSLEERVELEKYVDAIVDTVERLPPARVQTLTIGLVLRVMVEQCAEQYLDNPSPEAARFIRFYRARAALEPYQGIPAEWN